MLRRFFAIAVLLCLSVTIYANEAVRFVPPRHVPLPDPQTVGVPQKVYHGTAPVPNRVQPDRYSKIPEAEVQRRICREQCCGENVEQKPCPLCEDDPMTPCRRCELCKAGFPCERTLCRHCVQQRSLNMCNSCDLGGGDEPCGTCDACREHRSDPCEHADDGHGPRGEFNPNKEPRFMSVIPRPILDMYNNGARKFPVYYNPAPYFRPYWNPSIFTGYARPYSFRWSCPLCYKDPCDCDKPGLAGQVPYAYSCKFCNRNPCACAQDICNVTKPMNPKGIATSLADERSDSTAVSDSKTKREAEPTGREGGLKDLLDDEDDNLPDEKNDTENEESVPGKRPIPKLDGPGSSAPTPQGARRPLS